MDLFWMFPQIARSFKKHNLHTWSTNDTQFQTHLSPQPNVASKQLYRNLPFLKKKIYVLA